VGPLEGRDEPWSSGANIGGADPQAIPIGVGDFEITTPRHVVELGDAKRVGDSIYVLDVAVTSVPGRASPVCSERCIVRSPRGFGVGHAHDRRQIPGHTPPVTCASSS